MGYHTHIILNQPSWRHQGTDPRSEHDNSSQDATLYSYCAPVLRRYQYISSTVPYQTHITCPYRSGSCSTLGIMLPTTPYLGVQFNLLPSNAHSQIPITLEQQHQWNQWKISEDITFQTSLLMMASMNTCSLITLMCSQQEDQRTLMLEDSSNLIIMSDQSEQIKNCWSLNSLSNTFIKQSLIHPYYHKKVSQPGKQKYSARKLGPLQGGQDQLSLWKKHSAIRLDPLPGGGQDQVALWQKHPYYHKKVSLPGEQKYSAPVLGPLQGGEQDQMALGKKHSAIKLDSLPGGQDHLAL